MKIMTSLLMVITFYSCSEMKGLNNQIYKTQKQAILQSPYKSAKRFTIHIETQKKFRINGLPKLIKDKIYFNNNLNDTVLITESFDDACINCPSYWMKILFKDSIYSLQEEITNKNKIHYKIETEQFNDSITNSDYRLRNNDLIEIIDKIRNKERWMDDPLQYGSDNCNDGDHTIVTLVYPNKTIQALYVRCWTPFFYRKKKQ